MYVFSQSKIPFVQTKYEASRERKREVKKEAEPFFPQIIQLELHDIIQHHKGNRIKVTVDTFLKDAGIGT